jgi:hypothetical protein
MKKVFLAVFLLANSSCATITPDAANIVVHSQVSTVLDACQMLGPISAEASAWKALSWSQVYQQVKNNLRHEAATKYDADSIAIMNIDTYTTKAVAHGIAYKCF